MCSSQDDTLLYHIIISYHQQQRLGGTSPADQHAGVGQTQQQVVEEALQHRSVDLEVGGQKLGADGGSADEQRQALTHDQRLEQLPGQQGATF